MPTADRHLGSDALGDQCAGHLIGATVQLAIGERLDTLAQRNGLWCSPHLLLKGPGDGQFF